QAKSRWQLAAAAVLIGQAERFRGTGDVEQQRVRDDHEQHVDQRVTHRHLSESDRYLSARDATTHRRAGTVVNMRTSAFLRFLTFGMALLSPSFWSLSATDVRAQRGGDPASARLQNAVDTSIEPGDDFFAYANG